LFLQHFTGTLDNWDPLSPTLSRQGGQSSFRERRHWALQRKGARNRGWHGGSRSEVCGCSCGSSARRTFANTGWAPRLGLGVDVATGDRKPNDNKLETFNPLFPNGYYLAGYTVIPI